MVLPFGLTNAPSAFQHIINTTFSDITGEFIVVYLDDILIYSKDESKYLEHVKAVLQRLRDEQFKAKCSQCKFVIGTIKYLGYIVSKGKVLEDPNKTDAICSWPDPMCAKEVQQFLGLVNYYNQFIKQFAQIASPLTKLLQKCIDFVWSLECQFTFQQFKHKPCSDMVYQTSGNLL